MELDKRIKEGKRPLTCFDLEDASGFLKKTGYFANELDCFSDLSKVDGCCSEIHRGKLLGIKENKRCLFKYLSMDGSYENSYRFFLPEDWVLPAEKKYRALTLNEFLERFKIGEALYIRFKRDKAERVVVFTEYSTPPHKDEGNNTESVCLTGMEHHKSVVCLGMREYNLTTLFDCYEYFDGKEWQPFGVIEDD